MSIYEKIYEISMEVKNLQKNYTIKMRTGDKYNVILSEYVLDKIKPLMLDKKLIIFPIKITNLVQAGDITTISAEYKIVDVETGESEIWASVGSGRDKGDKGAGKAFTYSHKYALLKGFNIKTSDDPDKIASDVELDDPLYTKLVDNVNKLYNLRKIDITLKTKLLNRLEQVKNDKERLSTAEEVINGFFDGGSDDRNNLETTQNTNKPINKPTENQTIPTRKPEQGHYSNNDDEADIY